MNAGAIVKISTVCIYILAALLLCSFLWLAGWQYQRGAEKQRRIDQIAEQASLQPITANEITLRADNSLDLKQVAVSTDAVQEINVAVMRLDNKTRQGRVGVEIIQPLRVASGWLLVNYGWVPWSRASALPNIHIQSIDQPITGRLRLWSEKGFTLGEQEYGTSLPELLSWLDYQALRGYFDNHLLPYMLYIDASHPQAQVTDWHFFGSVAPQKHYSYAVQWLFMALALCVVVVYYSRRRPGQEETSSKQ